jgi:hypothetical protein
MKAFRCHSTPFAAALGTSSFALRPALYVLPFVKNGDTNQLVYTFIRNIVANHCMKNGT